MGVGGGGGGCDCVCVGTVAPAATGNVLKIQSLLHECSEFHKKEEEEGEEAGGGRRREGGRRVGEATRKGRTVSLRERVRKGVTLVGVVVGRAGELPVRVLLQTSPSLRQGQEGEPLSLAQSWSLGATNRWPFWALLSSPWERTSVPRCLCGSSTIW